MFTNNYNNFIIIINKIKILYKNVFSLFNCLLYIVVCMRKCVKLQRGKYTDEAVVNSFVMEILR